MNITYSHKVTLLQSEPYIIMGRTLGSQTIYHQTLFETRKHENVSQQLHFNGFLISQPIHLSSMVQVLGSSEGTTYGPLALLHHMPKVDGGLRLSEGITYGPLALTHHMPKEYDELCLIDIYNQWKI